MSGQRGITDLNLFSKEKPTSRSGLLKAVTELSLYFP